MPNGGSDCRGTCWFNARNKGEAGYDHARDPEPAYCTIRELPIEALDELVVWQVGEFAETRAVEALRRIVSFEPDSTEAGPFGRTQHGLVGLARDALRKIEARVSR